MQKPTNEDVHKLIEKYFEHVASDRKKELEENPDAIPYGFCNVNYTDKDIYNLHKDHRVLEDWEIEDVIECMAKSVYYDVFEFCGCGVPDDVMMTILTVLNCYDRHNTFDKDETEPVMLNHANFQSTFKVDLHGDVSQPYYTIMMWILYHLDALGLTEHGSNIYGSWLTDKGMTCRQILNYYKIYLTENYFKDVFPDRKDEDNKEDKNERMD